jgi:hypothetical protein
MVALAACSATQRKTLVHDTGACVLDQVAADLVERAKASATGSGEDWAAFSQGELLSRGVALAICVMAAVVKSLDATMPGELKADGSGRVSPLAMVASSSSSSSSSAASCTNPALLLAHDRAVDFLARYGVDHSHRARP